MSSHRATHSTPRAGGRGPKPVRSVRWWQSVPLRAALSLGLVLGIGSAGTFAYWTDQSTVTGITFTAGTLDLKLSKASPVSYVDNISGYTDLNISNMIPGQSVAAIIKVKNNGNVGFTYTASTSVTNSTLAGALDLKVSNGSVSGTSPNVTCSGTALSGTGTKLDQALVTTARSLAASASEDLCLQVSMPSGASTTLQGTTTDVSYTFTATQ